MPPRKSKGSSSSIEVNNFPSPHARLTRRLYESCAAEKNVLRERTLDLDGLRKYIPGYIDVLVAWGWTDFLCLRKYVMPDIVKHFYFFGEDKVYDNEGKVIRQRDLLELPTKLFNKEFTVSIDLVNEVTGVKEIGDMRALPKMNEALKLECLRVVFKKENLEALPKKFLKVSRLDVPERILHYLVAQFLFGRKRASEITDLDLYCMTRIMLRQPFNFGAFVVGKMLEGCVRVRSEKNFHCPFGKIITLICERLFADDKLKNVKRIEDSQKSNLEENIRLMNFKERNGALISPGYEDFDKDLRSFLRSDDSHKRKRYQRKKLFKALLADGELEESSAQAQESEEENEEEENENEEVEGENEEEGSHESGLTTNERISLMMEQLMIRERRERQWREEDVAWRHGMDQRMNVFEANQAEMKATLGELNEYLRRGGGGDGMEP